jgi:bifunctional DNA-binding transcriptional regulator/antitoxin component of YhaV-PrlF toxin-antitoxin module
MKVCFKEDSQITLPIKYMKKYNINEGDEFELFPSDVGFYLCPAVSYSGEKEEDLKRLVGEAKKETDGHLQLMN